MLQPDTDATPVSGPVGPLCQAIPADAVASLADLPVGDAAGNVDQLATLTTAVGVADLGGTLNGDGPFIVFAPVEDAFAAVPADTLSGLLDDPEALGDVLTYHVVAGEQNAERADPGGHRRDRPGWRPGDPEERRVVHRQRRERALRSDHGRERHGSTRSTRC